MTNTLITHLQVFLIGFSFGIAGPCFLVCTPIIVTYVAGNKKRFIEALGDIFVFLTGRLAAYLILGCLAGASAALLKGFIGSQGASFFRPIGGAVSVLFGVMMLVKRRMSSCRCPSGSFNKAYSFGGLFILGFMLGITPCGPLVALLSEITLISRNVLDGMSYALSFGLGTFLSGLIVVGCFTGIIAQVPERILRSERANFIFRAVCAVLLMLFGVSLIIMGK